MNWLLIIAGMASGLITAIVQDLDSYSKAEEQAMNAGIALKWSWKLAAIRWIKGTLLGAIPGLAISPVT